MKKIITFILFFQLKNVFAQNKPYLIECDKIYQEGDTTVCFLDWSESAKQLKHYKKNKYLYSKGYIFNKDSTFVIITATDKFGYLNGTRVYYSKNKKRIRIEPIKNGEPEGITTFFDESGNITAKINYHKGKEQGIYTEFWQNGQIYKQLRYEKGRLKEVLGIQDSNGKSLPIGIFSKRKGHLFEYNEKGQLIGTAFYKNGKFWHYRPYGM